MREITDFYQTSLGDVVLIKVTFEDNDPHLPGTNERLWRRFAIVIEIEDSGWGSLLGDTVEAGEGRRSRSARCLDIDSMDKKPKIRMVWLSEQCRVFLLEPEEHPQGVTAMRMRAIMLGLVPVSG